MWGQDADRLYQYDRIRIIPTRVGTSPVKTPPSRRLWDHPHACGDKTFPVNSLITLLGSSPRVWGQERYYLYTHFNVRIIPTRVGTSRLNNSLGSSIEDHPHACGDKSASGVSVDTCEGSSPRVWGQELIFLMYLLMRGIIPTRVGTSL